MKVTIKLRAIDAGAAAPLAELRQRLPARGSVTLDLGEVQTINSVGARHWAEFLRALTASGCQVELCRCPATFIDGLNLLDDMAADALVSSFFAPFDCRACDVEQSLLVESHAVDPAKAPPAPQCPSCGAPMTLDIPWEEYVRFLDG